VILDPDARTAGLEVIRRIRDSHPYVKTIALTVRRGLAHMLADEGAEGYVIKKANNEETIDLVKREIRSLIWENSKFWCASDIEEVLNDKYLGQLVEKKYFLSRVAEIDDSDINLVFCSLKDVAGIIGKTSPSAVIAVVVSKDMKTNEFLGVFRNLRNKWNRKVVILLRTHFLVSKLLYSLLRL
jgi:CheY-like chemotaxis protein